MNTSIRKCQIGIEVEGQSAVRSEWTHEGTDLQVAQECSERAGRIVVAIQGCETGRVEFKPQSDMSPENFILACSACADGMALRALGLVPMPVEEAPAVADAEQEQEQEQEAPSADEPAAEPVKHVRAKRGR